MSGPAQWDSSDDPRESSVGLPRLGLNRTGGWPVAQPPAAQSPAAQSPAQSITAQPPLPQPANAAGRPREADSVDGGSASTRPPTWSLADLRGRLGRLPEGHPSSPFEDDGTAKPPAPRLRQLELGLPAPERDRMNATAGSRDPAQVPRQIDVLAEFRNGHEPISASDERAVGEPTAVADPAGEPAADATAGEPAAEDLADELVPLAELPGGLDEFLIDADTPVANGSRHWPSDSPTAHYSTPPIEPPSNGDGHQQARPELQDPYPVPPVAGSAAESVAEQPESAPLLSPEHEDLVKRTLAAYRAAEGRNMFDGYGERGITPAIRRIASQLPRGGLAPDSETASLKTAERFSAKLARLTARFPGTPVEELAASISDGVRYAFTFEPADYTESTRLVQRKLKAQGFELQSRRNRWISPEYKGIWTRWRDPAHEQAFEVQFHTMASWAVVQRTHDAYTKITDPRTAPAERARLRARQVAAAEAAKPPAGCMEIADFRQEAR